ncbi:FkbM family methyltransferase [Aquimarina sp. EL_43]|uniref:FkbM family methyltransferase n=1 Tax=unclassified Aquimarina TaxID=2627091 RepID=UPI0018C983C5|nr:MULTISPECIES: FkbM family methyltransferase [unclassified Aquimarina]MBG6131703.1 FkbM family methyltransferase [Aquimarina sp. EL_35]MBG6152164.1 FkbM family methyltransferase [Aquimarina sp. EL_32]MBG6169892.1 FkbM family methyltransferase [Aquimarina sp. EL_43]
MSFKKIILKIKEKGLKGLINAIISKVKYNIHKPKIILNNTYETISLGTDYGAKVFVERPDLQNSIIVSCGVGEDISFDIEFAKKYNATIVMLDPTPRAIDHYDQIIDRIRSQKDNGSTQDMTNNELLKIYDLSMINEEQLILEELALWTENTMLNFYLPVNKSNVSHSLVNYQNDYKQGDEYGHIKVKTTTLNEIMEKYKINNIELLKLDIEGAEIEVLENMLDNKIFPNQICVEFDGLNVPSKRAKEDFEKIDKMLRSNSYEIIYYDGLADFTYLLNTKNKN